jgi:hypothetical protein
VPTRAPTPAPTVFLAISGILTARNVVVGIAIVFVLLSVCTPF